MVPKTSDIFDVTVLNKKVIPKKSVKLLIPQMKGHLSCLTPLKALSSIVSLVGVSSENKIGVLEYALLIPEIQTENTRF